MKKQLKRQLIVVGTNSLTESQYPAYSNHCQFWFRLGRSHPNIDFVFMNPSRMSIDRMRNATFKVALETNADYVLFLDDDVIVNPHVGLQQLIDCNSDIAAGRIVIRGYPFDYMVFKWNQAKTGLIPQKTLPKTGIRPYDAVGFSFTLIKTAVFRFMSEPWLVTGPRNTEDIYFCLKARQLNKRLDIKVNCDCHCGHILWPEVMDESNRAAYKKYYETINPELLEIKNKELRRAWRGKEYLAEIKEISDEKTIQ